VRRGFGARRDRVVVFLAREAFRDGGETRNTTLSPPPTVNAPRHGKETEKEKPDLTPQSPRLRPEGGAVPQTSAISNKP